MWLLSIPAHYFNILNEGNQATVFRHLRLSQRTSCCAFAFMMQRKMFPTDDMKSLLVITSECKTLHILYTATILYFHFSVLLDVFSIFLFLFQWQI